MIKFFQKTILKRKLKVMHFLFNIYEEQTFVINITNYD